MVDKKLCTGCTACAAVCKKEAITMINDTEGFKYPEINKSLCINCNLCDKVCPAEKRIERDKFLEVYCGYTKDKNTLISSSSGGIATHLAKHCLSMGGVVCGCTMDDDMYGAKHIFITKPDDLNRIKGSKYLQSSLDNVFLRIKEYLKNEINVLFFGTPCQVAGLSEYLTTENISKENLVLVDFICHGVPSPLVWEKYLKEQEQLHKAKAENVFFRNKSSGWKNYSLLINFSDGTSFYQPVTENLYLRGFVSNYYLRPSCYHCNFKNENYYSDITLGDFWSVEKYAPNCDNKSGVSLIITNSKKGSKLLSPLKNEVTYEEIDFANAIKSNPSYSYSVKENYIRKHFFNKLKRKSVLKLLNKYCSDKFISKVIRKAVNILGGN